MMISAADTIEIIGKKILPEFSLKKTNGMMGIYDQVYTAISKSMDQGSPQSKSVFLIGGKGVGKSLCMKTMNGLFRDTNRMFKYTRAYDLIKMLDIEKSAVIKEQYGYDFKCDLYIDDIGLGQIVKNNYGNHTNLIAEVLIERYELFISDGFKTHLSSNRFFNVDRSKHPDVPATIMDMYGDVVCDRLVQMSNIIIWEGGSLRV